MAPTHVIAIVAHVAKSHWRSVKICVVQPARVGQPIVFVFLPDVAHEAAKSAAEVRDRALPSGCPTPLADLSQRAGVPPKPRFKIQPSCSDVCSLYVDGDPWHLPGQERVQGLMMR